MPTMKSLEALSWVVLVAAAGCDSGAGSPSGAHASASQKATAARSAEAKPSASASAPSSTTAATSATAPSAACERPLSELCPIWEKKCPKAADAEAFLKTFVFDEKGKELKAASCKRAELGKCGAFTTASYGDGFSSFTVYFDAKGDIVAGVRGNDHPTFCDGKSMSAKYGDVPQCTIEAVRDVCAKK